MQPATQVEEVFDRFHATLLKVAYWAIPLALAVEVVGSLVDDLPGIHVRWYIFLALWLLIRWQLGRARPHSGWLVLPISLFLGAATWTKAVAGIDIGLPDSATTMTVLVTLFSYQSLMTRRLSRGRRAWAALGLASVAAASGVVDGLQLEDLYIRTFVVGIVALLGMEVVRRMRESLLDAIDVQRSAAADLQEVVDNKDRLVASVSHELRTPLTGILGFAESLLDMRGDLSPEVGEFAEVIAGESRDMADIIEDLLVAARADMGTLAIKIGAFDLEEEVKSVLASSKLQSLRVGKSLVLDLEPSPVEADPLRSRQIIRNLLNNAFRYGGSSVWVGLRTEGRYVRLWVSDDGDGLQEGEDRLVFEPYYTARQTPSQPGSVGIGLAVSRQLARLMGGEVTLHRTEGRTVFTLILPAADPIPLPAGQAAFGEV